MDDASSPHSSRGASPVFDDDISHSPTFDSIDELSQRFDQYNLRPRASSYFDLPPSHLQDHHHTHAKAYAIPSRTNFHHVRQQREINVQRQCNLSHRSRISALVNELQQDSSSTFTVHHPSSIDSLARSAALSKREPPSFPGLSSVPSVSNSFVSNSSVSSSSSIVSISSSDECESDPLAHLKLHHITSAGHDLRHSASTEALRRQGRVLKKARLRKRPAEIGKLNRK
ncbi:hypothetical protein MMC06_003725 [Schaereria dolodes]|nr:hypothetical protein [Schaereria dolodes]